MRGCKLDTLQRVADVEEATGLMTPAVDREGMADDRFDAESVERGTEQLVVIEARDETIVEDGLVGVHAVHDTLVEIRCAQAPDAARKENVVRVVHLREVVEAPGLFRERHGVAPSVVLDLEVALFDVDVGGAVLPHRAQLQEMRAGHDVAYRPQHIERADDVVGLCEDGVLTVDHGVRRRSNLAVVHDRLGLERPHRVLELFVFGDICVERHDLAPGHFTPGSDALVERHDRGEALGAALFVFLATKKVVDDRDLMVAGREMHGCRPSQIAVTAEDHRAQRGLLPVLFAWVVRVVNAVPRRWRRHKLAARCMRSAQQGHSSVGSITSGTLPGRKISDFGVDPAVRSGFASNAATQSADTAVPAR